MDLFERFGGPEVGALARSRFLRGDTDAATLEAWVRLAFPLYTRTPRDPEVARRAVRRPEVTRWFCIGVERATGSTCSRSYRGYSV